MILSRLTAENFRIFGSKAAGKHLDITVKRGLTVLAGENDSGKTALMDALRLLLWTTSQDYIRISEDDFHKVGENITAQFTLYCRFEGLTVDEQARFQEWLSIEPGQPALEITLHAHRVRRRNRKGVEATVIEFATRSGPNGQGRAIDGDIRAFLRLTYLKPLRDAEMEMTAGKGSRLSQLLLNHPSLQGQEKNSELVSKPDKPVTAPSTLRGIMGTAEKWIQGSPAILEAKRQLNEEYLANLSIGTDKLRGEITIGKGTDLKAILEKLELWVVSTNFPSERTRHGLGVNNLLFMAAELLLLSESAENGLPLLLIEEPEAHLHPQLQLRLMEFLESKTSGDGGVQVLLTTHSPTLSSHADVENVTVMAAGHAYPLARQHTKLTPSDYRFLRRFLDTTKANLFFAKSVVLVEGDAENLLLPIIANLLGRSFATHGVSIVKVGSRGLFRYSRVFQRTTAPEIPVRVACISDRDIPPDEAKNYVPKKGDAPKFMSEMVAANKLAEHLASLGKHDGGVVRTFVSESWTLEHDLALAGLGREVHLAISIARKLKNIDRELVGTELTTVRQTANSEFDEFAKTLENAELAARIYQPLFEDKASKAEVAQVLGGLLEEQKMSAEQLRAKLPRYLIEAISYATRGQ